MTETEREAGTGMDRGAGTETGAGTESETGSGSRTVDEAGIEAGIETDVVVVGAGPTGLTLAYELALAGVGTLVLEKLDRRIEQVKGGALQPRTLELLEMRGLLEQMRYRATERETIGGHFALLPVPLDCTPWQTRHPYPLPVPQWAVEEGLQERAEALGARVRRGAEVTEVIDADDEGAGTGGGLTVRTANGLRVRARYLVACDGGHSAVRKLLGLPFPGRPGRQLMALADIRLSATSPLVPRNRGHISGLTRQAGGYWTMLVPIVGDRYRFTFGSEGGADTGRDTPVTDEEIAAALRAVYGEETVLGGVENSSRFSDATRQLRAYRVGRVLFAGDAAHIHPPLGGQGLNIGVQDAFNLGWKLAATVQDRAPEGLLHSYHTERHPVAAQVLHHTSAQRVLADTNPSEDVAALRDIFTDLLRLPDTNRHLAGLMSGLSLRYDLRGDHPLTGQRAVDTDLLTPSGPIRLSSLFASGRTVLLDLSGALPPGFPLPGGLDLVTAERAGSVRAGGSAEPPEPLGADVLLIRPDGYISWAAEGRDATPEAVREALARLLAPAPGGERVPG